MTLLKNPYCANMNENEPQWRTEQQPDGGGVNRPDTPPPRAEESPFEALLRRRAGEHEEKYEEFRAEALGRLEEVLQIFGEDVEKREEYRNRVLTDPLLAWDFLTPLSGQLSESPSRNPLTVLQTPPRRHPRGFVF